MRICYDSNNLERSRFLYNQAKNVLVYSYGKNTKSYYFSHGNKQNDDCFDMKIDSMKPIVVLNYLCPSISLSYKQKEGEKMTSFRQTFSYCTSLPFGGKEMLGKITRLKFDVINKKYPYISIRMTDEVLGRISTTYTATNIVQTSISESFFVIPTDKPLVEF